MATDLKKLLEEQRKLAEAQAKLTEQIEKAKEQGLIDLRSRHSQEYAELGTTPEEVWADVIADEVRKGLAQPRASSTRRTGTKTRVGSTTSQPKKIPSHINPDDRTQVWAGGPPPKWLPRGADGKLDRVAAAVPKYQLTDEEKAKYKAMLEGKGS